MALVVQLIINDKGAEAREVFLRIKIIQFIGSDSITIILEVMVTLEEEEGTPAKIPMLVSSTLINLHRPCYSFEGSQDCMKMLHKIFV